LLILKPEDSLSRDFDNAVSDILRFLCALKAAILFCILNPIFLILLDFCAGHYLMPSATTNFKNPADTASLPTQQNKIIKNKTLIKNYLETPYRSPPPSSLKTSDCLYGEFITDNIIGQKLKDFRGKLFKR